VKAPDHVFLLVTEFWKRNMESWKPEIWPEGNTHTNHWSSPTYILPIVSGNDDSSSAHASSSSSSSSSIPPPPVLRGAVRGSSKFQRTIYGAAKSALKDWTGVVDLVERGLYGIRIHTEGSIVSSHVDRLPQVLSVVMNVAQDVDEPWPMELIGHDGIAHNVTLDPGDLLLYESHSIIHGYPFPLRGRYHASLFVHMEPTGHTVKHHGGDSNSSPQTEDSQDNTAPGTGRSGGHETEYVPGGGLPPYLLEGSPEAANWHRDHDDPSSSSSSSQLDNDNPSGVSNTPIHDLAAGGRLQELVEVLEEKRHLVDVKDHNGWTVR
jgi:prolyl 4-hydroxylase